MVKIVTRALSISAMGKSRVKKTKVHRENANYQLVTNSSVEPTDSEQSEIYPNRVENPSQTIKALSTQLQSSSVEDRDCACIALTNLIRNSNIINALFFLSP